MSREHCLVAVLFLLMRRFFVKLNRALKFGFDSAIYAVEGCLTVKLSIDINIKTILNASSLQNRCVNIFLKTSIFVQKLLNDVKQYDRWE